MKYTKLNVQQINMISQYIIVITIKHACEPAVDKLILFLTVGSPSGHAMVTASVTFCMVTSFLHSYTPRYNGYTFRCIVLAPLVFLTERIPVLFKVVMEVFKVRWFSLEISN